MGGKASTINLPAHDGSVLRMGVGNVSTTACQNPHPSRLRALNLAVSLGYRITHLEGTLGGVSRLS